MKITVDIDCTPQEARTFLGLPDVEPLQKMFMNQMQEKMAEGFSGDDMEKMFNMWLTPGLKGLENMQNMFWNAASGGKK